MKAQLHVGGRVEEGAAGRDRSGRGADGKEGQLPRHDLVSDGARHSRRQQQRVRRGVGDSTLHEGEHRVGQLQRAGRPAGCDGWRSDEGGDAASNVAAGHGHVVGRANADGGGVAVGDALGLLALGRLAPWRQSDRRVKQRAAVAVAAGPKRPQLHVEGGGWAWEGNHARDAEVEVDGIHGRRRKAADAQDAGLSGRNRYDTPACFTDGEVYDGNR